MLDFTYCTPTRYVFGRGAENQVGALARNSGMTNVLLVYGQGSVIRSGLLARVKAALDADNVSYADLGGVQPNPLDDLVYRGIDEGRRCRVDGVVAVGGGSAIDTAKAIAGGIPYDGDFWDFFSGKARVGDDALPVGVVLTIPAAGSEGSGNSVITRREGMQKVSLRTDTALRPRWACLDPELTFTLPPAQTAAGVADMMAHIMERYFSTTTEVEVTDRLSEGLLMAIMTEAPRVMARPDDYQARANIMWAATLAHNGICGTGRQEDWASHGMEHELSALYGVTHGAGLAVIFPAWMTYMADHRPGKVAQLARRVLGVAPTGDDRADALEGVARLRRFFSSLGLPVTMKELGIDDPDIDLLVQRVHRTKGDPFGFYFPLDPEASRAIYTLAR